MLDLRQVDDLADLLIAAYRGLVQCRQILHLMVGTHVEWDVLEPEIELVAHFFRELVTLCLLARHFLLLLNLIHRVNDDLRQIYI